MQENHGEYTLLVILHGSLSERRLPDQYAAELRWALEHKQSLPEDWKVKACEAFRTDDPEELIMLKEYVRDVFGLRPLQGPWNDRVIFRDPQLSLRDFAETKG